MSHETHQSLEKDGFRALLSVDDGRIVLRSRRGTEMAPAYPEIVAGAAYLPDQTASHIHARQAQRRRTTAVRRPDHPRRSHRHQGGGARLNHHASFPEQRGALDVIQVGPGGARARGTGLRGGNKSYRVYGQSLYAPCDGTVVSAADHLDDQEPGTIRYQPPYGNHVFIDTGTELVKLAHLRRGTVTVRTGDPVHAGQLLGEVGNSGNSTEPHLHIHAERDSLGLDLQFTGVTGPLCRGRTVRT